MDIQLNFVNFSMSAIAPEVVLFQRMFDDHKNPSIRAWKNIVHCGFACNHPFVFPLNNEIGIRDSYGNESPRLAAVHGQAFSVQQQKSGHQLVGAGLCSVREVQVLNELGLGALDASIYKDGRPILTQTAIAPGQKAVFQVQPVLCIAASQRPLGPVFHRDELAVRPTRLALIGLQSAEIVMTGGGGGADALPFSFALENIILA